MPGQRGGPAHQIQQFPGDSEEPHRPGKAATTGDLVQCAGGPASGRAQLQLHKRPWYPTGVHPLSWTSPARLAATPLSTMPLLLTGRGFRQELEQAGALALYAPLEGGAETRLLRRMRAAGYRAQITSARGLGDPEAFLLQQHGVRPPHLGHQSVGRGAAVGEVQMAAPQLGHLFDGEAPVLLWLLEGQVLSQAELSALVALTQREPRLKIVVELGGARALRWQSLASVLNQAA